ncbi:MAG: arylsulfatase, partial [Acidobacteriaceae bacterium]|nr:arylsulfatase [Acidobacteriaceae bacterium]
DVGCFGQKVIRTPNLDRMAAEGMRFTQAYAGSTVCAPSRCALMTGKHTAHCRVRGNKNPEVPLAPEHVTIAEVLHRAGYRTGMFGKWGLGSAGTTGIPNKKGFDEFFGYHTQLQAHTYYPQQLWDNQSEYVIPGNFGPKKKVWSPDLMLPRALRFIEANRARPFFLCYPFTMPHADNELGADTGDGMEIPDYGEYAREAWPSQEKGFAAMVTRLDADVGRILAKLHETGVDENTLVIFSSDNGPHHEGGHNPEFFHDRGPLRGVKRDLYEGGIREPTIARWPGKIRAGSISDQVWAFWDVLPTFAELGGGRAPAGIDGISMVNALLGRPQQNHEFLYWEFHEGGFSQAIRMGDWKAVRRTGVDHPIELYDLHRDPGESHDVAGEHSELVDKMRMLMRTARTESDEFPAR